jgi:hypothetical protein
MNAGVSEMASLGGGPWSTHAELTTETTPNTVKGTTETTILMAPLLWSTPPELAAEPIILAKGTAETTIFMARFPWSLLQKCLVLWSTRAELTTEAGP